MNLHISKLLILLLNVHAILAINKQDDEKTRGNQHHVLVDKIYTRTLSMAKNGFGNTRYLNVFDQNLYFLTIDE